MKKFIGKLLLSVIVVFISCVASIYSSIYWQRNTIIIEDLNVSNMLKDHDLAKEVANVGFYEFRRQLEYKCKWSSMVR